MRAFIITVCLQMCLSVSLLCQERPGQPNVQIKVNANDVLADVSSHPLGVNASWMLDSDTRLGAGGIPFATAMTTLGLKFIRYPGAEEANDFLWSKPPYIDSQAILALPGPNRHFPNQFEQWVGKDHSTLVKPYEFDAFIKDCREFGCVPVIVVPLRPYRQTAQPDSPVPTREELIRTAVEWVRYANITKKYGIKYWEIGNEYWNDSPDWGPKQTVSQYIRDVQDFSAAMKKVDPSIRIGAGAYLPGDGRQIVEATYRDIDFVSLHSYPLWFDENGFVTRGFKDYQKQAVWDEDLIRFEAMMRSAKIPEIERQRLLLGVTETNSLTGGSLKPGSSPQDLWHGMALFDIVGAQLRHRDNLFSLVWVTHWVSETFGPNQGSGENLLTVQNKPTAVGLALSLWGRNMGDEIVGTSDPLDPKQMIHSFATMSRGTRELHVMVVNKDVTPRHATIQLNGFHSNGTGTTSTLKGTGPFDEHPHIEEDQISTANDKVMIELPGPGIVVVILSPAGGVAQALSKETPPNEH